MNILTAIDFSATPAKIVCVTRKLALSTNAKMWLVHVAAPDPERL